MVSRLTVADLFSGCGGITRGFLNAGFHPQVAVEFDRWAASSYAENFGPHVLVCPIQEVEVHRVGDRLQWHGRTLERDAMVIESSEIDVLVGGPPCQGFSPLGRMSDWTKEDPRNQLWRHYVRVLEAVMPKAFVIENVPELLRSAEFDHLVRIVSRLGYKVAADVLRTDRYGVPQSRRRAIIIGSRVGFPSLPPVRLERRTVRDAIGDLPAQPDGNNWHLRRNPTAISIERYKTIPAGGNRFDLMRERPDITPNCWLNKRTGSTDVFGRMLWDKPAPTIRTEFFKPEKGRYLHPHAQRPITIREAARLQTFPDDFIFVGSAVQVAKQIGNAVPVLFAERLAEHLRDVVLSGRGDANPSVVHVQERLLQSVNR